MLTSDLALSWRRGDKINPRYISTSEARYLQTAEDLINIFREHQGRQRAELDQELDEYVGAGTDYKILRGMIKLLADRCLFDTATAQQPAEIRRALFLKARAHHPVNESAREQLINEVAVEMGCARGQVIEWLYADLAANQRIISFEEMSAAELIDRYNLAQAQALLYRCTEIDLRVEPQEQIEYRRLFDAIKNYRLIHLIRGSAKSGYEIKLSGPVSIFHRSQKYGIQMAVFLPALIACRGWKMRAEIDLKERGSAFFEIDSRQTRLRSDYWIETVEASPVAEKFSARWTDSEWKLERCKDVIDLGGGAFIPEFVLQRGEAEKVYVEILGFWTPKYLTERLKEFERARMKNFILAVSDELRGSREAPLNLPPNVVTFKSALDPREVRMAMERMPV
jgi:predicted nuclease of restriction endonuclease-like RecB superfamily